MANDQQEQWSPARAPYAIAVSQSWWAFQSACLFAADARRSSGHEQQIYARQIFGQLRTLRRCAEMEAKELERLKINAADRAALDLQIEAFDAAVPDAKPARDVLEHFDEYACGEGRLQHKAINDLGLDIFEAAAMFWGGGYDPTTEEITEGPFVITIPQALEAAEYLYQSIYTAAKAVDESGRSASQ